MLAIFIRTSEWIYPLVAGGHGSCKLLSFLLTQDCLPNVGSLLVFCHCHLSHVRNLKKQQADVLLSQNSEMDFRFTRLDLNTVSGPWPPIVTVSRRRHIGKRRQSPRICTRSPNWKAFAKRNPQQHHHHHHRLLLLLLLLLFLLLILLILLIILILLLLRHLHHRQSVVNTSWESWATSYHKRYAGNNSKMCCFLSCALAYCFTLPCCVQ